MSTDKYHKFDKQMTKQVRSELLASGITEYPVTCDYCDAEGRVETDNNGPIGPCPVCYGKKQFMVAI